MKPTKDLDEPMNDEELRKDIEFVLTTDGTIAEDIDILVGIFNRLHTRKLKEALDAVKQRFALEVDNSVYMIWYERGKDGAHEILDRGQMVKMCDYVVDKVKLMQS